MSNNKQQTKLQPVQRTFEYYGCHAFGKRKSPNLDILIGTPNFYGRTENFVKEQVRTYNRMSTSLEVNNNLFVTTSSNQNFINIVGDEVEMKGSRIDRFSRREGTKSDKPAFQLASAKRGDSMNQIEPNIVKRRINEYNCLQSLSSFPHPSLLDQRFIEDLKSISEEVAFDFQTSSDEEESESRLFESRGKIDDMYDKHVKNGKKKMSKKTQLQNDHRHLVKFYRKLFSKMTQVPFAIAVVYCSLFFIIQAISVAHTFIYPS